jgi:hypothetical protein
MSNNNNLFNEANTKNLWCRDTLVHNMIKKLGRVPFVQGKGFSIRECTNGSACKGAHTNDEIILFPNYKIWNRVDKTTFNFPDLYFQIINVINIDKFKMKMSEDAKQFKIRIEKISELNFIEVLQLWRDLATYFRKICKTLPRKKDWKSSTNPTTSSQGYVFSDDVPYFGLDDKIEEHAWSLERITKRCHIVDKNIDSINKRELIKIWDICVGDKNCKEGYHYINDALCVDNFLTGKCSCISKEDFESELSDLKNKYDKYELQINDESTKTKRVEQLKVLSIEIKNKYNSMVRKIHYTDLGMKPFTEQLEKYKENKIAMEKKAQEEEEKKVKPTWDHGLQNTNKPIGKVIKIKF